MRRRSSARALLRRRSLLLIASSTALPLGALRTWGADRYWVDTNSVWTANFWSIAQGGSAGASVPGINDNAYVLFNDGTSRTITYNASPIDSLLTLDLDNSGLGTSTLSQSQGLLGVTNEYVGFAGNGAYVLGGGSNTVNLLEVGGVIGGRGTYTLNGPGVLSVQYEYLAYQGVGTVNQSAGTHNVAAQLLIGGIFNGTNAASNGTYTLAGGTLTVGNTTSGSLIVGDNAFGTFTQSAGSVTTYDLALGKFSNGTNIAGTGTYNLISGSPSLTVRGGLTVGDAGNGTFIQGVGTVSFTQTNGSFLTGLTVGRTFGGSGLYQLNGGSITAPNFSNEVLGLNGAGTFNQTGGSNTTYGLYLGYSSNGSNQAGTGTYNLSGGTLNVNQEYIGIFGNGTFSQSNGAHIISGTLHLGSNANGANPLSTGTLNLSGGTMSVGSFVFAGDDGVATINQTGGTLTVGTWLFVGNGNVGVNGVPHSGFANYTLSNGILNSPGQSVGYFGTNQSTLTQSGGTNNASNFITVGDQPGNVGVYNLQDGVINAASMNVAWQGNGTFNQSGGTNNVTSIRLGHEVGGNGTYNLTGGTLNAGGNTAGFLNGTVVGYSGTGSFVQTGGTHTITQGNFTGLLLGYLPGSAGSYRLDNGTLNVNQQFAETFVGYLGTGTFTQNGGTHNAYYMTTGYVLGGSGVYTMNNGALNVTAEYEGWYGNGTFNQTAGTHNSNYLFMGYNANGTNAAATGAFNLSGGTLTVSVVEQIGLDGSGTFIQNGGSHSVTNVSPGISSGLSLGLNTKGLGSYTLNLGDLTVAGDENVGYQGTGTFTQNGGSHTVGGRLYVAALTGSAGTFNLNGGTLTAPALNNGTFSMAGGNYSGAFTNAGTFNYSSGGFTGSLTQTTLGNLNVSGPLSVSAGVTNAGNITIFANGSLSAGAPGFNNDGGSITLYGGSLLGINPIVNGGAINGYGTIGGDNLFTNNGLLTQFGGNLTFSKTGGSVNNGQITLASGRQLLLSTPLTNNATLDLGGAIVNGAAALRNSASGLITGPGTVSVPFTNAGTLLIPAGQINVQRAFLNTGSIQLNDFTSHLVGGAASNTGTIQGFGTVSNAITNDGTIEAIGGTLVLSAPLQNNPAGILRAGTGAKLLLSSGLLVNAGLPVNAGIVNLAGGTFDNNGFPLNNTGQLSGFGTFATGGMTNNGAIFLTGGNTTVNGAVNNPAGHKISVRYNPALFTGPVVNSGTFEVIGTTATFAAGGPLPAPLPDAPLGASGLAGGALDGDGSTLVQSGGGVVADHIRQASLSLDGTVTIRPGATAGAAQGVSRIGDLPLVSPASTIDLTNNALVVDHTGGSPTLSTVRGLIISGRNNGAWNGHGITSSTAAANSQGAVGYALAGDVLPFVNGTTDTFLGLTVDKSSVLTRYTLAGDVNLDGSVDFLDLAKLAQSYNVTDGSREWATGDFNYDGSTDFLDLAKLAQNYNTALPSAPIPGASVDFNNDLARAFAAVPEPSGAIWVFLAAGGLGRRLRRRRR
jgi:hypothetical protein